MEKEDKIFVSSVMKSGTWLLRNIITEMTGLKYFEPLIPPGDPYFGDPDRIIIPDEHYFSWHSYISDTVAQKLIREDLKVIFLIRNIYDVVISLHNHFLNDVDKDTGHSSGLSAYLSQFNTEQQLTLIITGFSAGKNSWIGITPIIKQIEGMLRFAKQHSSILISFENLNKNRLFAALCENPVKFDPTLMLGKVTIEDGYY